MPESGSDILSALRVLQDAPREALQAHRDLALQIFEQVRAALTPSSHDQPGNFATSSKWGVERLCANVQTRPGYLSPPHFVDSASSSAAGDEEGGSCRSTVSTESTAAAEAHRHHRLGSASVDHRLSNFSSPAPARVDPTQSHARKRKRGLAKQSRPEKLLSTVRERLPRLIKFSKKRPSLHNMLQNSQEKGCLDIRLDHIKRVDGNKTPNEQERLLKGLCQISLAQQFTAWERERGWIPRVDQLRSQVIASRRGVTRKPRHRLGKISQYIRDNKAYCESDYSVVNKSICQGTIQLLFKSLIEDALGDSVRPNAVEGIFAAVTIFESYLFQSLKIDEMLPFLDLLLQEDSHFDATDDDYGYRSMQPFTHSLMAITAWSTGLQNKFESICRTQHQDKRCDISEQRQITPAWTEERINREQSDGPSETSIVHANSAMLHTDSNNRSVPNRNTNELPASEPNEDYESTENLDGQGGSDVATSDLDHSQLDTVRELALAGSEYDTANSTQGTGNMIVDSVGALQLQPSLANTQDSSSLFHTELRDMATMHPCAFPQFVPPASIDTVVPSTSPQYFLPESMSVETMVPHPEVAAAAVDIMVSSNFPQFTPAASTNSLLDPDYYQTNTSCTVQTRQNINNFNAFAGIIGTPTSV